MGMRGISAPAVVGWVLACALANTAMGDPAEVRFIVIAEPRTGSTLLVDSLDEHPEILAHREVLRFDNWDLHAFRDSVKQQFQAAMSLRELKHIQSHLKRNATFYINHIFDVNDGRKAVGFKMFHWHLRWMEALKVLKDPGVKKIVLYRKSLLAKITSHQVAGATGGFHGRITHDHIKLDVERAVESAEATLTWFACVRDAIADQEYAVVAYEDLDQNFQSAMHRLTDFLGVSPNFKFHEALQKQAVQPPEETAKNADEVTAEFIKQQIPEELDFFTNPRHYNDAQCHMLLKEKS
mmetsp:Transcript_21272/g.59137  ORF Transcript_21272/g.59137 Transcript_21272/m.59137 type:complete len:295 (-) Transcript_21272:179-1063(-)